MMDFSSRSSRAALAFSSAVRLLLESVVIDLFVAVFDAIAHNNTPVLSVGVWFSGKAKSL